MTCIKILIYKSGTNTKLFELVSPVAPLIGDCIFDENNGFWRITDRHFQQEGNKLILNLFVQ